jgi:hypothetical protein
MTDEIKDLLEALSGAPLSEEEKTSVRTGLRTFMNEHPASVPWHVRMLDTIEHIADMVYSPRMQAVMASLALVVVAGTGTAYAAGNALPGQPLYAIKVNIEEPVQGAFATSAQAQASWNAELASRRLTEAAQLAATNELTPAAQTAIASGLDQATENFDASIAQLATSSSNVATAANLESSMEATLAANTQVLTEIQNAVPSAAPSIQPLLSRVRTRALAVSGARAQLDVAAATANVETVKAAAEAQLDAAEGQLNGESAIVNTNTGSSGSAASSSVAVQQAIKSGQANLQAGNYGEAFETLQTAALVVQETQIKASVSAQVKTTAGVDLPAATSSATGTAATITSTSSDQTDVSASSSDATSTAGL